VIKQLLTNVVVIKQLFTARVGSLAFSA